MKRFVCLICLLSVLLCACRAAERDTKAQTPLSDARLENIAALQKNLFTARVLAIETQDALLLKYNLDITRYTVYTVEITESVDRCTPCRRAKLYQVGTKDEFPTRVSMAQGETYLVDAEPWVYGNDVVFLLSPYADSFLRVDITGFLESGESVDSVAERYTAAWEKGAADASAICERYVEIFDNIAQINGDLALYDDSDRNYAWKPSQEFRRQTADASRLLADKQRKTTAATLDEAYGNERFLLSMTQTEENTDNG